MKSLASVRVDMYKLAMEKQKEIVQRVGVSSSQKVDMELSCAQPVSTVEAAVFVAFTLSLLMSCPKRRR